MFIPHRRIQVFDDVEAVEDIETLAGVFTAGHRFIVTDIGRRGYGVKDKDGNRISDLHFGAVKLVEDNKTVE